MKNKPIKKDYEIDNEVFVKTKPDMSYEVEIKPIKIIEPFNIEREYSLGYDAAKKDFALEDEANIRGIRTILIGIDSKLNELIEVVNSLNQ